MVETKKRYTNGPVSTAKRLKKMEAQIYRNRPEMKSITFNDAVAVANNTGYVFTPCRISQGTGVNQRIGDKVRVWRVEVRGYAHPYLDQYVLQQKTTTQPDPSVFTAFAGAYILDSENTNRFTEWKHYRNPNGISSSDLGSKFSHKFKTGIIVKYNGPLSTNVVDNEISVFVLNRSGTAANFNQTVRMWYTDA